MVNPPLDTVLTQVNPPLDAVLSQNCVEWRWIRTSDFCRMSTALCKAVNSTYYRPVNFKATVRHSVCGVPAGRRRRLNKGVVSCFMRIVDFSTEKILMVLPSSVKVMTEDMCPKIRLHRETFRLRNHISRIPVEYVDWLAVLLSEAEPAITEAPNLKQGARLPYKLITW